MENPEDELGPLDEADPVQHHAVQAAVAHKMLDSVGVPRFDNGRRLSLWGRVTRYAKSAKPERWKPEPSAN